MKLSAWAKREGLTYQTAWNLFKAGKLPVEAKQLKSGTILVDDRRIFKINLCEKCKKDLNDEIE